MIEAAAVFAAEHGIERLSIANVARLAGINRTTAYYYFSDRIELVEAVQSWTAAQIEECVLGEGAIDRNPAVIGAFALKFPVLVTTLIESLVSARSVRSLFPRWDRFAAALTLAAQPFLLTEDIDPDVLGTMLLTSLLVAPLILKTSLGPKETAEQVSFRIESLVRQLPSPPKPLGNPT